VNARDAMPSGGKLRIEVVNVTLEHASTCSHGEALPAGEYVMLSVHDTGVGMSAETQNKIFEPFFTTKEQGKGTGLGLATVYGIVKQSKGYIVIESELGSGTTFNIYLPLVKAQAMELPEPRSESRSEGTETILFAKDEQLLRRVTADYLRSRGYKVLEATNGMDALAQCKAYKAKIDLLITDVVMPGTGGIELAEEVAKLRPGVQVLLVSGYTDRSVNFPQMEPEISFLQKPFSLTVLGQRLRQLLDTAKNAKASPRCQPEGELCDLHR